MASLKSSFSLLVQLCDFLEIRLAILCPFWTYWEDMCNMIQFTVSMFCKWQFPYTLLNTNTERNEWMFHISTDQHVWNLYQTQVHYRIRIKPLAHSFQNSIYMYIIYNLLIFNTILCIANIYSHNSHKVSSTLQRRTCPKSDWETNAACW